jgi:outer membrane protein
MLKSEQEKKVTELQGMEQQLQQLQANAQTDFQQEKDRLYAPIFAEADSIIKLVAKENGYTFVFDAPALLYADTTRNLLPLIKVKMGLPDKPADASKKK